jgi:predicted nucleic acid-binding protein
MTVVIDASLLVAVVSGDPRADAVGARLAGWLASGEAPHAPRLTQFEVANGLTRLVAAGSMPEDRVEPGWQAIQELPITYHPLRNGPLVVSLARRLERHSAYDAARASPRAPAGPRRRGARRTPGNPDERPEGQHLGHPAVDEVTDAVAADEVLPGRRGTTRFRLGHPITSSLCKLRLTGRRGQAGLGPAR